MSGNLRFESTSSSADELAFSGNHINGNRASHSRAIMDRSGTFRENCDNRMFGALTSLSRESSTSLSGMSSVSDFLILEPITIGELKYPRLGEIRKILGISFGSNSEDSSFGASVAKLPHPGAIEELKRFRSSIVDTTSKARKRAKKLEESLHKLSKYHELFNSKKHQRNGTLTNARPGGSNLLKMASQTQSHRNSSELLTQGFEDRSKSVVLNKRVRSSITEPRVDNQGLTLTKPPLVTGKDRDMTRNVIEGPDSVEEKNHRLPAGGEGWDRKMKRKRSVGSGFSRPMAADGEIKRNVFQKIKTEPGSQSSDPQGPRLIPSEETAKVSPSQMPKAKGSRAPRSGSVAAASSPTNFPRSSGTLEAWEESPNAGKVHVLSGTNNRKRPLPSESSSPPMAQWVGHRQKISRNRRANVVSPVSNHNEIHPSSEACASDAPPKTSSIETGAASFSRSIANGIQQLKVKLEKIASPARIPENEESGAGPSRESRMKEKRAVNVELDERDAETTQNVSSSIAPAKKNKTIPKADIGDGVQRQGRSGRVSSFPRTSISPAREKLESAVSKPLRSAKPGSDKNASKTGRPPLKKLSDRKAFIRHGKTPTGSTPDISGGSDDDHEELLEAANSASQSKYLAHSGAFWKRMELFFSSISSEDTSFLKQQGDLMHEESLKPQKCGFSESDGNIQDKDMSGQSVSGCNLVDQIEDIDGICGELNPGGMKVLPIYQRLLAALIIEDDATFDEGSEGRNMSFSNHEDENHMANCLSIEEKLRNGVHTNYELKQELQTPGQYCAGTYSCNGSVNRTIQSQFPNSNSFQGDCRLMPKGQMTSEISENGFHSPVAAFTGIAGIPCDGPCMHDSIESKLLMELHSVGLYPDNVPDLVNREDEVIYNDISDLQKQLARKVSEKKALLDKLLRTIPEGSTSNTRELEQTAMERLVEMAYRKQLATRASIASRNGIPKVPKHVAMAFTKRTLARCKEFEDTGKSCFSETPLSEVLFAAPPHGCEESFSGPFGSKLTRFDLQNEDIGQGRFDSSGALLHPSDQALLKTGTMLSRGKKKELLLDDVGAMRVPSSIGMAKGKRSERDRDRDYAVAKGGRQNSLNSKGERKAKSKPKQRIAQLSSTGNGFISKFSETTHPVNFCAHASNEVLVDADKKGKHDEINGSIPFDSKDNNPSLDFANLDLQIDSIEDLDVPSWLNFEGDGLQDHDSMGLEIPMDDLSDVHMFL